jgi:3-hydroxyisobutyrate dehydrogenase
VTTIAFLGTGAMGAPMARNLVRAGHVVRVWNRTATRAEELVADGAVACGTPAEACDGADVLVTMLADGPATAAAVQGVLRPGLAWAQMGTVGVEWTERFAGLAAGAGTLYADAPVLGSLAPAESGELTVLAAGSDEALDACQEVFDVVGSRTLRLGAAGNGTRMKLVLNFWVLGQTALVGEVVSLAEALGVGAAQFLDLIEGGFTDAPYARLRARRMLDHDFAPMFSLALGHKDVSLALEAGTAEGLQLDVAAAVGEEMRRAIAKGYGAEDIGAVVTATSG